MLHCPSLALASRGVCEKLFEIVVLVLEKVFITWLLKIMKEQFFLKVKFLKTNPLSNIFEVNLNEALKHNE